MPTFSKRLTRFQRPLELYGRFSYLGVQTEETDRAVYGLLEIFEGTKNQGDLQDSLQNVLEVCFWVLCPDRFESGSQTFSLLESIHLAKLSSAHFHERPLFLLFLFFDFFLSSS